MGSIGEAQVANSWQPDVLGEGFECLTFDLGVDELLLDPDGRKKEKHDAAEGTGEEDHAPPQLAATLVRSLPKRASPWSRLLGHWRDLEDVDVLYVHGWADYFFQKDLARFWTSRGARFFALDLRRYGRSLREQQTPGYITNLADYDEEIELAIDEIRSSAPKNTPSRKLVLFGHSTGGLILSLWANRNPGVADALVLNSPWLEFQFSARVRQLIASIVHLGARVNPLEAAPQFDRGFYSRAQAEVGPHDELEGVNLTWRPLQSHPVHGGWLSAIFDGHRQVSEGLDVGAPVCVLLSARSAMPTRWSEDLIRADSVIEVDEVARAALHLGTSVTVEWIDGALHDVFLSAPDPRADAYARLERWVRGWRRSLHSKPR